MTQSRDHAPSVERIRRLESEISAAHESGIEFERQIAAARTSGEALEDEIEGARGAIRALEAELDSARQGSADLEARLERSREHAREQQRLLHQWITRCTGLERALRAEWFRRSAAESQFADESLTRLTPQLNIRPSSALVQTWPLTDAVPPGELIYRTSSHRDREHFANSRAPGLQTVLSLAEEGGCEIERLARVLDFGCGCGRLLAAWEPYCPPVEVCGVDLDGDLIDWCNEHLPFVEARRNRLEPPLDYPTAHFDLVYAASVFTHLTADAGRAWAEELRRLLRPGGTLVASYHGPHYHEILRRSSASGYDELNQDGFHVTKDRVGLTSTRAEGSNAFAAFHSQDSFRALFADWDLRATSLAADRGPTHFASYQDVMVFRRT